MTERFRPYRKTKRPNQDFECLDCGINTLLIREYYMLTNKLWNSLFPEETEPTHVGMLCISCVETRLGRKLEPKDFSDAPLNRDEYQENSSPLLRQRIKGTFAFMEKN